MHSRRISAVLLLAAIASMAVACERHRLAPPLTDQEIATFTEGQPQIFIHQKGSLTLEGIEQFYLGQSYEDAMEELNQLCEVIQVFEGGWRHKHARFKGCDIYEEDRIWTARIGFWPFNDDRVSTLEIQSQVIPMRVVRARFSEIADELTEDLPRRGILMMASTRYKLMANWDDGLDEPVHLIIGYHPP